MRCNATATKSPSGANFARRAHHVADAMTVGIAVDAARPHRRRRGLRRPGPASTHPARCCLSIASVRAPQARSASASVRMPHSRNLGSGRGRSEPRLTRRPGPNGVRSPPRRASRRGPSSVWPARSGAAIWASSRTSSARGRVHARPARPHSRSRTARSKPTEWPMRTAPPRRSASSRPQLGKSRRIQHGRGVDAVDAGRKVGDHHVRPDQAPIGRQLLRVCPPAIAHQRNLDDARLARVEAGRLGVDGQARREPGAAWRCLPWPSSPPLSRQVALAARVRRRALEHEATTAGTSMRFVSSSCMLHKRHLQIACGGSAARSRAISCRSASGPSRPRRTDRGSRRRAWADAGRTAAARLQLARALRSSACWPRAAGAG